MNDPQRYAEVKRLFLEAVPLAATQRARFLDEQDIDSDLKRSVETLLIHHDANTVIGDDNATTLPAQVEVAVDRLGDQDLASTLSPQFVAEVTRLVRSRLGGLATMISLAYIFGIGRSAIHPEWDVIPSEVVLAVPIFISWAVLIRGPKLTLAHLRILEAVIMSCVCVGVVTMDVSETLRGAALKSESIIAGVRARSELLWCMVIMVYGIFVPNRWQRAAIFLFPLSCVHFLTTNAMSLADPDVFDVLSRTSYERPVPMLPWAALCATPAAHLFHRGRADTFRARQLAQYKLGRLLGRGGMGEVYEAEHSLLKRRCAVKLIRPERRFDEATLARFEKEVQTTAKLTHPNTIDVYDYGQTINGTFFYVMEFLNGKSLDDLVANHGVLPASRACYLLQQACGALQEAHDVGFVHRDVKPGNLFVCHQAGRADFLKVLDFGLVTSTSARPTHQPRLLGTPPFMSPEQGIGFGDVDPRSDIYALGATAYFLVTGSTPFASASPQEQLLAHLTEPVEPPSQLVASVPNDLEAVIMRCLEKEKEARFQSMTELQDALNACDCARDWTEQHALAWWKAEAT